VIDPLGDLPADVRAWIGGLGAVAAVQPLTAGYTGAPVVEIAWADGRREILKGRVKPAEAWFYREFVPGRSLAEYVPTLEASFTAESGDWLLLERVQPLAVDAFAEGKSRRQALVVLAALHAQPRAAVPVTSPYEPRWPEAYVDLALPLLPPDERQAAEWAILAARERAARIFEPRAMVSADTNANNWGSRTDGSLVLFDWERICAANPAIDVAILLPGLAGVSELRAVAEEYCAVAPVPSVARVGPEFARDVLDAKLWVVLEFAAAVTSGLVNSERAIAARDSTLARLPAWLRESQA
jgi:hypothetical protein